MKLKSPSVVAATLALAAPVFSQENQPAQMDQVSYFIGMQIAQDFKNQGIEVNVAALGEGMADALAGKEPKYTQEQLSAAMTAFQGEMQKKREQMEADANKEMAEQRAVGEKFLEDNGKREGVVTTASGLQYEVLTKGEGALPQPTDQVKVHYHGTLVDGKVFDSSVERGDPVTFPVQGVIQGWVEALQIMPVGSKWKLFIPSKLAYGESGAGADIGPGTTLIFEVELLDIVK
jgi:FKBP-type peptidyl-prolyl cis-trans isomerase